MDTGFLLMRQLDQRHGVIGPRGNCLEDFRSAPHTKHTLVQLIRQRVYQMAAGYGDCNDAGFLWVDPALQLPHNLRWLRLEGPSKMVYY